MSNVMYFRKDFKMSVNQTTVKIFCTDFYPSCNHNNSSTCKKCRFNKTPYQHGLYNTPSSFQVREANSVDHGLKKCHFLELSESKKLEIAFRFVKYVIRSSKFQENKFTDEYRLSKFLLADIWKEKDYYKSVDIQSNADSCMFVIKNLDESSLSDDVKNPKTKITLTNKGQNCQKLHSTADEETSPDIQNVPQDQKHRIANPKTPNVHASDCTSLRNNHVTLPKIEFNNYLNSELCNRYNDDNMSKKNFMRTKEIVDNSFMVNNYWNATENPSNDFKPSSKRKHLSCTEMNKPKFLKSQFWEQFICGICRMTVLGKKSSLQSRFGVLRNCEHVFCYTCIRKNDNYSRSCPTSVRPVVCPLCKVWSPFAAASSRWVAGFEKNAFFKTFDSNMSLMMSSAVSYGKGLSFQTWSIKKTEQLLGNVFNL